MAKKLADRASRRDKDNPEWTSRRARPASEVLPRFQKTTDELVRRRRGRPARTNRKVNQTLRLDPGALEAYRREGPAGRPK
jgi:uncharacterized protein (DUF4415 family)